MFSMNVERSNSPSSLLLPDDITFSKLVSHNRNDSLSSTISNDNITSYEKPKIKEVTCSPPQTIVSTTKSDDAVVEPAADVFPYEGTNITFEEQVP
jgi:hypothetical protein